ncbi:MAG: CAP domain-containing protein [Candidatus Binataceae bacterium]
MPSEHSPEPAAQAKLPADLPEPARSAIERQNHYRETVNLPPVEYEAALSAGAEKHARYLLRNQIHEYNWYVSNNRLGAGQFAFRARQQSPDKPEYSKEGAAAAREATIFMGPAVPTDGGAIIDQFVSMPFSSLNIFHPQLRALGFGAACEKNECITVASLRFGLPKQDYVRLYDDPGAARWNPALGDVPVRPARLRTPIRFPPDRGTADVLRYEGNGALDALVSCEGYDAPSGAPIILMLGGASERDGIVKASEHSLANSKGSVEHCVIDASSYRNPNGVMQDYGRRGLKSMGAVVLIPRAPLAPGERYDVSITADRQPYSWSFTAGEPTIKPRQPTEPAEVSARAESHDTTWLSRVNYYRALVDLRPVGEDPRLSKADLEHARYMAKNRVATHQQDPANAWHTAAGDRAARQSNVWWGYGARDPGGQGAVDFWMEAPFHRLSILNADLRMVGFAQFTEDKSYAAALNAYSAPPNKPLAKPIMFPPLNSTTDLFRLSGETPNPLTSCAGYQEPSGLPVTLQLGQSVAINLTAHTFASGGKPLEHCVFDASNYTNSDAGQQQLGRAILRGFGAVVLVPRDPLHPGTRYDVSLTVGGQTYSWSFTVTSRASAAAIGPLVVSRPPANEVEPTAVIPDWLAKVNFLRAMHALSPVTEDAALTDACFKHARYVLENHTDLIRTEQNLGHRSRQEEPASRWFSEEGAKIAPNVDMAWGCGALNTGRNIERAIDSVFHRFAMLDPKLTIAGLGAFEKDGCWVSAIRLPVAIGPPTIFDEPVEYPPNGSKVSTPVLSGEWPDPLSSCPGYGGPAGLPLTVQFGCLIDAQLASHSITENGRQIEHCGFDAKSYANPDPAGQEYGRWALKRFGAVALIPREPLHPGTNYDVTLTTKRGKTVAWSFAADVAASAPVAATR